MLLENVAELNKFRVPKFVLLLTVPAYVPGPTLIVPALFNRPNVNVLVPVTPPVRVRTPAPLVRTVVTAPVPEALAPVIAFAKVTVPQP